MLIKIYTFPFSSVDTDSASSEQLHIIDNVQDVVIHQGNYAPPEDLGLPVMHNIPWGPQPSFPIDAYESTGSTPSVRIIDYSKNGERRRALVKLLAYVCNDQGKTIERVEVYSGAKLSKS